MEVGCISNQTVGGIEAGGGGVRENAPGKFKFPEPQKRYFRYCGRIVCIVIDAV